MKGVYPAVSTQFNADQSLNIKANQQVIDTQINDAVDGIICLDTVDEDCSLLPKEKRLILKAAQEVVAIFSLASQGLYAEALQLYRWFLPLLKLDAIPTLVQCIKLAEHLCGRGSEIFSPPRLPLEGAQREAVIQLVEKSIATRPDLNMYR